MVMALVRTITCMFAVIAIAVLVPLDADARLHAAVRPRAVHGIESPHWVRQERASPTSEIVMTLLLATETPHEDLDELVHALSDVRSSQYGQFLTNEQLRAHWSPTNAAQDALQAFLADHNEYITATHTTPLGDTLALRMSVGAAERIFSTSLFHYHHRDATNLRVVRPERDFHIPEQIAPHVVFIDGLEALPTPGQAQLMANKRAAKQDYDPSINKTKGVILTATEVLATPDVIRTQYDISSSAPRNATHAANKLVVAAFLNEYYHEQDLATFVERYDPSAGQHGIAYPAHSGKCMGDATHKSATGEASLDVQVAVSLSRSGNIEMLCLQDLRDPTRPFADDNQEPFLAFMQHVNAMDPPPSVVSISYTDEECAMPHNYMLAVNREFMKAAMKGITIVISAGDAGVLGGHVSNFCSTPACGSFRAMFPASSPYVTTVGATSLDVARGRDPHSGKYFERVTSSADGALITSGGGFSRVFAQPSYQTKAIASYLEATQRDGLTSLFNAQGRAYPDLSALGHAFPVIENGQLYQTDGTSVSAPIVASIVVLLNKLRLEQGHTVLGFLNPLLYQLYEVCPHVFEDITEGEINCGAPADTCCPRGHTARAGWDAASGVGTVRFETLARDLNRCISQIRARATTEHDTKTKKERINLLQASTTQQQQVEQLTFVVATMAGVALFSMIVALRGTLLPGRQFFEQCGHDPTREYLLAHTRDP